MVRGGKVSGKRTFRKKVRSKEGGSDDSDEDYVVSDEDRDVSDYYCSSLDGCASEESFENFMEEDEEEEEKEFQGVRNFNRSKVKNDICGRRRNASKNSRKRGRITYAEQEEEEEKKEDEEERGEEEENEEEEEEEEEIQGVRNFNRSKAKNGVWGKQKNASKATRKRGRITHAEQLEEEEEEEMEEEEKVERDGEWEVEGDGDEEDEDFDFDFDDEDDEFTPEEEDYSDEEEELRERKKKNSGMKMGKKVLQKRTSVTSTRGRKRRSSRASKKPLKNKRRKNGGLRRKIRWDNEDGFIDSCPAIKTTSRKKGARKRRRLLLADSDSECVSSGSSDFEYTISEEEREQMREAKELCGSLQNNLRSSSFVTKNEEVGVHEDLHQQRKPPGRKGKEKIEEPQGRKGKEKVEDLKSEVGKQVCGVCLSEEDKRRVRGVLNCCTHYFCFACIMEWAKVESRCPLCKQRFKTISKSARSMAGIDLREMVIQVPERDQVFEFCIW